MTWRARTSATFALAGCMALALLQVALGEKVSPIVAVGVPLVALAIFAIWRNPMRGVQLALLTIPLESLHANFGSFELSAAVAVLLVTAAVTVCKWISTRTEPWMPHALVAMCGLLLAVLLGMGVAEHKLAVAKIFVIWAALTIVAVMVANADLEERRKALWCLTIAAGITGAIAVAHGSHQEVLDGGTLATNRAQGSFSQPNVLAFFLVLAVPVSLMLALEGSRTTRLIAMLAAGLAIAGLVLTLSRDGIIGGSLSIAMLLLWRPFRRMSLVALAVMLAFTVGNLGSIEKSSEVKIVQKRLATLEGSDAVGERGRIYATAPKMFLNNLPFGVGEGNFEYASLRYDLLGPEDLPYNHAHDVLLTIAVELGIPGLIAIIWMWCCIGDLLVKAVRARWRPREGPIGVAIAASVVAIVPSSIADYPLRTDVIAAAFLILIAMLAASVRDSCGQVETSR